MDPSDSLPHPQESPTGLYPRLVKSSPHSDIFPSDARYRAAARRLRNTVLKNQSIVNSQLSTVNCPRPETDESGVCTSVTFPSDAF